jgi:hypothetical protein
MVLGRSAVRDRLPLGTAYGRVGEDTAQHFPNADELSARRAKTPDDVEEMEC